MQENYLLACVGQYFSKASQSHLQKITKGDTRGPDQWEKTSQERFCSIPQEFSVGTVDVEISWRRKKE